MSKLGALFLAGAGAAGGFVAARRWALPSFKPGDIYAGNAPTLPTPQATLPDTSVPAQRLIHIARIRIGSEAQVRQAIERFPVTALAGPGIQELSTFVGSSYVVSEYGFTGEFAPVFAAFRAHPGVAAYIHELAQLLDDEPVPVTDAPGRQSLASQALHWDTTEGLSFTPHVRDKGTTSSP